MMSPSTRVGIDAIAIAVPEYYVELAELAAVRGVPAEKYRFGLGVERMAVAAPYEDSVTLAANAARRVLELGDIDPAEIGQCVVGTETAVDHAKPIAAYIHRLAGLPSRCRVFEAKHACFGGTAGLLGAVDWIASGAARGRKALIVCTDIARYQLRSPGEPTQGAGAVAMIVSEQPRLVALEPGISGSFAKDVHDFWRPLWSKEALVDGHYSVECYLEALEGAYRAWKDLALEASPQAPRPLRRCYHVPYGKMAKKAHRRLCTIDELGDSAGDETFAEEVGPSLRLSEQIGNIYTGSLYLALASVLETDAPVLAGERIGLFSYGSGCAAEYFAAEVEPAAGKCMRQLDVSGPIRDRQRLSIPDYEKLRSHDDELDRLDVGAIPVPKGRFGYRGLDDNRRTYG